MFTNSYTNMPLVSVILPVYERQQFLANSIQSVLTQSYKNVELIVVDDGSSESLEGLVLSLAPRARYFRQSHAGVAAARNRGLQKANGELIAFLDSDDAWHPEKLAYQVDLLKSRPGVGVVCTGKRAIDESGKVVGGQWKKLYTGRVTEPLFREVFITMPSVLMWHGLVECVGSFDTTLRINSDYQYWLRASLETEFAALHMPLVDVRRSTQRLTLACTEAAVLRYRMLADFYSIPEARQSIRPAVARQVLARAAFCAARALWKERRVEEAKEYFSQSLSRRLTPRASLGWLCTKCGISKRHNVSHQRRAA